MEENESSANERFRKGNNFGRSLFKQVQDTASWVDKQLQAPGIRFTIKDSLGAEAEVSVSIPKGGIGEIIFSAGGSLQHHPAQCRHGQKSFRRGAKVKIVDVGPTVLYIDNAVNVEQEQQKPKPKKKVVSATKRKGKR